MSTRFRPRKPRPVNLHNEIRDLAYDLREGGYSRKKLGAICQKEAPRLGLPASEVQRKVEAAYKALFFFGKKFDQDRRD